MSEETNYAQAAMLIRKPIAEVFNAFIDPEVTSKIWFTKSTGKLQSGETITWTWEMFNHSVDILVKVVVPNKKIRIQWGDNKDALVDWDFEEMGATETFATITNTGFVGSAKELIAQIRDATEGFTLVLAGLKAYLEHGLVLELVADRYPKI